MPIEFFSGAVRVEPWLLFLDIALIFHFFVSWYLSARNTGWTIDPWYVGLFLSYFISFLLQYPFAASILNFPATGGKIFNIQTKLNQAYFITGIGFMAMFCGSGIFKYYGYQSAINLFFIKPIKNTTGVLFKNVVVSNILSILLFLTYILGLAIILYVALQAGYINNPRAYFYYNEDLRAIYNFITVLSRILALVLIGRIFQFNKISDKIFFILFIIGTLFIGARGYLVGPIITYFSFLVYFKYHGRVKMKRLLLFSAALLILVVGITSFRSGATTKNIFADTFGQVVYGNSFSDLRDFAWVLSAWDGKHLNGNTYLAGFMSFIPSTYSHFRSEWAIGRITAILGGFDPKVHPGLRPGLFGEAYLNFGLIGVIFMGLVLGYYGRYLDYKVKFYSATNNKLEAITATISGVLVLNLPVTSGFFSVYVMLLVFAALFCLKIFFEGFKEEPEY